VYHLNYDEGGDINMNEKLDKVFVYGTLMEGYGNHRVVQEYVADIVSATTTGELYQLTGYPGMLEGNDTVHGELITLKPDTEGEAISAMDRLEGHPNFYKRTIQTVCTGEGTEHKAYVYIYQNGIHPDHYIPGGDWGVDVEENFAI
jgi:gamma-glutamylcyclotransferase (GGCT)/AIG2-like uncharacterized protein YtfP